MRAPYKIIKSPVISEKGTLLQERENKYIFEVNPKANKIEIKHAIEELFNVQVKKVNTMNVRGKKKRVRREEGMTSSWKKAFVTLLPGQKIEFI